MSGRKFKKCHAIRETLKPINVFEQEQRMLAELREGYCSLPAANAEIPCSNDIVNAHTIQRKGGLSAIAENDHVLTVKPLMKNMINSNGDPEPRRVSIRKASVFPGFCSVHDHETFKPIEGKVLNLDAQSAFLFSYRAIAYERFSKEAEGRFNAVMRDVADRGQPFWKQAAMQSLLYDVSFGISLGKRDMNRAKEAFDKLLLEKNYEGFRYCAMRFDRILPVVACCAFHPEFDLSGTRLQQLGQDNVELEIIALTVTTFEGSTVAVLGWIGAGDGPARSLTDSLLSIDGSRRADALIRLLFIHSDNLFLKPTWWEELPWKSKAALKDMTRSGTMARARRGSEYADSSLGLFLADVIEERTE